MKVRIVIYDGVVQGHSSAVLRFVFHSRVITEWLLDNKYEFEAVPNDQILQWHFIVDEEIAMAMKLRYGDLTEIKVYPVTCDEPV